MAGYVRITSSAPIYFLRRSQSTFDGPTHPWCDRWAVSAVRPRAQADIRRTLHAAWSRGYSRETLKIDSSALQHFATWKMRRPRIALERLVAFCILSLSLR